jgi:hypothetical protein
MHNPGSKPESSSSHPFVLRHLEIPAGRYGWVLGVEMPVSAELSVNESAENRENASTSIPIL